MKRLSARSDYGKPSCLPSSDTIGEHQVKKPESFITVCLLNGLWFVGTYKQSCAEVQGTMNQFCVCISMSKEGGSRAYNVRTAQIIYLST